MLLVVLTAGRVLLQPARLFLAASVGAHFVAWGIWTAFSFSATALIAESAPRSYWERGEPPIWGWMIYAPLTLSTIYSVYVSIILAVVVIRTPRWQVELPEGRTGPGPSASGLGVLALLGVALLMVLALLFILHSLMIISFCDGCFL